MESSPAPRTAANSRPSHFGIKYGRLSNLPIANDNSQQHQVVCLRYKKEARFFLKFTLPQRFDLLEFFSRPNYLKIFAKMISQILFVSLLIVLGVQAVAGRNRVRLSDLSELRLTNKRGCRLLASI